MKFIFIVLCVFSQEVRANLPDTLPLKQRIFKTTVLNATNQSNFGYLSEIKDSTLMLSPVEITLNSIFSDNPNIKNFRYQDISTVKVRRKGTTGRAILVGATSGFIVGATLGFIEGSDPVNQWFAMSAGEKAITYGGMGSIAGTLVGAIAGALINKKFVIGGKKEKFDAMRMNVLQKTYGRQKE